MGLTYHRTASGKHLRPELEAVEVGDEVVVVAADGAFSGSVMDVDDDRIAVETRAANPSGHIAYVDLDGAATAEVMVPEIDGDSTEDLFRVAECGGVVSVTVASP